MSPVNSRSDGVNHAEDSDHPPPYCDDGSQDHVNDITPEIPEAELYAAQSAAAEHDFQLFEQSRIVSEHGYSLPGSNSSKKKFPFDIGPFPTFPRKSRKFSGRSASGVMGMSDDTDSGDQSPSDIMSGLGARRKRSRKTNPAYLNDDGFQNDRMFSAFSFGDDPAGSSQADDDLNSSSSGSPRSPPAAIRNGLPPLGLANGVLSSEETDFLNSLVPTGRMSGDENLLMLTDHNTGNESDNMGIDSSQLGSFKSFGGSDRRSINTFLKKGGFSGEQKKNITLPAIGKTSLKRKSGRNNLKSKKSNGKVMNLFKPSPTKSKLIMKKTQKAAPVTPKRTPSKKKTPTKPKVKTALVAGKIKSSIKKPSVLAAKTKLQKSKKTLAAAKKKDLQKKQMEAKKKAAKKEVLYCLCRKPHGGRFMICCDKCNEWFHGSCVRVTAAEGRSMSRSGAEWVCSKCKPKPLPPPSPSTTSPRKTTARSVHNSVSKSLFAGTSLFDIGLPSRSARIMANKSAQSPPKTKEKEQPKPAEKEQPKSKEKEQPKPKEKVLPKSKEKEQSKSKGKEALKKEPVVKAEKKDTSPTSPLRKSRIISNKELFSQFKAPEDSPPPKDEPKPSPPSALKKSRIITNKELFAQSEPSLDSMPYPEHRISPPPPALRKSRIITTKELFAHFRNPVTNEISPPGPSKSVSISLEKKTSKTSMPRKSVIITDPNGEKAFSGSGTSRRNSKNSNDKASNSSDEKVPTRRRQKTDEVAVTEVKSESESESTNAPRPKRGRPTRKDKVEEKEEAEVKEEELNLSSESAEIEVRFDSEPESPSLEIPMRKPSGISKAKRKAELKAILSKNRRLLNKQREEMLQKEMENSGKEEEKDENTEKKEKERGSGSNRRKSPRGGNDDGSRPTGGTGSNAPSINSHSGKDSQSSVGEKNGGSSKKSGPSSGSRQSPRKRPTPQDSCSTLSSLNTTMPTTEHYISVASTINCT